MIAALGIACMIIVVLGVAVVFAGAAARRASERAAQALADSMAREIKATAERKAKAAADAAVQEVRNATNEDLERIARDLARRDRVP